MKTSLRPEAKSVPQMNAQNYVRATDQLAALLDVDARRLRFGLVLCIIRKVGLGNLLRCLSAGENWLDCLADNFDLEGVLDCLQDEFGTDGGFS